MRKPRCATHCVAPLRVRLWLPICGLMVLSGCWGSGDGARGPQRKRYPHNAPITVADGSMVVRTGANLAVKASEVDITGGQACSITVVNGATYAVKGLNWTITSADQQASVTTGDLGNTVVAYGPNIQGLNPDASEGQGAEIGVEVVQFSPASLSVNGGAAQSLDCGKRLCKIRINYWVNGTCS